MQEINMSLFHFFNGFSSNTFIGYTAPLLADLPIFFLPIFLLGMWLYYNFYTRIGLKENDVTEKTRLLHIFYGCIIAIIISLVIQQFVDIPRPETAITGSAKLLLEHIPDASFPSDHASVGVAFTFGLLFAGYSGVFWAFLPWIILMCISRVIAGVHWPLDIVVGAGVGVFSAYIASTWLKENTFVKNINLRIIHLLSYIKL